MTTNPTDVFEISDDRGRLDLARVHHWLSTMTSWGKGCGVEKVMRAAENSSLVVGAYDVAGQVGYLRVISDRTEFAYLCDVFVVPESRRRGVATAMLRFCLQHPEFQKLKRWVLIAADDAQAVYHGVGFCLLPDPQRWMVLRPA